MDNAKERTGETCSRSSQFDCSDAAEAALGDAMPAADTATGGDNGAGTIAGNTTATGAFAAATGSAHISDKTAVSR